jgi:hypothetical protein
MAFTQGNKLGAKSRIFEQTVKRAIAQDDYQALRNIVNKMVSLAEEGERWAVEMLRDTLDGKPAQQLVAQDEQGRELSIGLVAYARPATDSDDPVQVYASGLPVAGASSTGDRH